MGHAATAARGALRAGRWERPLPRQREGRPRGDRLSPPLPTVPRAPPCQATLPCAPQGLKHQTQVKLNIVSCPPVTTVLIKRPDLKYQLGFSVQNGIVSQPAPAAPATGSRTSHCLGAGQALTGSPTPRPAPAL